MSTGVELLLRSPLVAAQHLAHPQQPQACRWDASAALGVLFAAAAALRPHGCDPVVWRPQRRSVWLRSGDPARRNVTWLGHPATGGGMLWAAWDRYGQPLRWSNDPADNGPVRHFMAVHYTVNGTLPGDADAELGRWCAAMGPQLSALDGWIRDPERGQHYRWVPQVGYVAGAVQGSPGRPATPAMADVPPQGHGVG